MSDGPSEPPPTPEGHELPRIPRFHESPAIPKLHEPPPVPQNEPTEIPRRHEPPPIPLFHEPPPVPEFHDPPSVPDAAFAKVDYQPATVEADPERVLFVVENSIPHGPPHIPVIIDPRSTAGEPSTFLPWVVIILALLSAPCIFLAAITEMGFKWIPLGVALMFSLIATSLGGYAKEGRVQSLALARLSFQLGFGFLIISCVATIAALIQDAAELKRWSERMYDLGRKFHDLAAYIWGFFAHLFGNSSPATPNVSPLPSPTATPIP